jgi:hypothetical protein
MDKTKYVMKAEVEKAFAMPKTLQAESHLMPIGGTTTTMYAVYGRTDDDRRVWCATFIDSDEAIAWIQASRVFGRAVFGAVIVDQKPGVANDGAGNDSREPAEKPN